MTTANHYKSNLRDIEFNLFEFLDIGRATLGRGEFESHTEDSARDILRQYDRFVGTEMAASFVDADRHPPVLDADGEVHLPESLRRSLAAFYEAGWHLLSVPERLGGIGAPSTVGWAAFELLATANAAAGFFLFAPFTAKMIDWLGTAEQKRRFIRPVLDNHWGGTMVLTEPDAGSDVGAGRTRATPLGDGTWAIEGVKRFITNGEYDAVDNIVHLVLARPDGAGPGTKGLSMFIVPKFWVNEDGSLGARNGVKCVGLEKKMGIKGSVTCELAFGDGVPARGLLMGEVHDGIRQMFHLIEQARMAVGIKSIGELSAAYLHARDFTKERVQGPDLRRATDKHAPRVRIIEHPDVRRMLLLLKSHAEGLRALALFTASIQDRVALAGGHGNPAAEADDRLNDLLLPLVKGYSSDRTWDLLSVALQCFGGNGYMQDYPIEQYIRDQKIDTLYEGTTHIQSLDLILRKVARDGGETLRNLLGRVHETIDSNEGGPALEAERALLAKALEDVEASFLALLGKIGESVLHVGLNGNRILHALAELVIGWLLVRHAATAAARREAANSADRAFYDGKVASARFYCAEVLPKLALVRQQVEGSRLELIDLAEESF
jgi:hypothetical protein